MVVVLRREIKGEGDKKCQGRGVTGSHKVSLRRRKKPDRGRV